MRYVFSKIGMTSSFVGNGDANGVTVLRLNPGKVIRHETVNKTTNLVVVEFDIGRAKKVTRGYKVESFDAYPVGEALLDPKLVVGQLIKVTAESKGKGFQDAVTRHGFAGGPASHGSRFHRAPGSVGMRTQPGRTPKGKRLPGHMGNKVVTLKNVEVVYFSVEEKLLAVKGGVPGAAGGVVFI